MNKKLLLVPALFMSVSALIFTGCSDDEDTTAPSITINGDVDMEIELQDIYDELGATAIDGEDGTVAVSISGDVDTDLKGVYVITYTASDESGNTSSAERTVTVVNSADFLAGSYIDAQEVCNVSPPSVFDATVTSSNTVNGDFTITNFGAFGTSATVTCNYNAFTNNITAVTPQNLVGSALLTDVYAASELITPTPVTFQIVYEWSDSGGGGEICTSTYTK